MHLITTRLFAALLLLAPSFCLAQYPTAVGTKWEYFQFWDDIYVPQAVRNAFEDEVVGDTVAGGNTYQVVRRTGSMYNCFINYVYDILDGTYYYRVVGSQVRVLDTVIAGVAHESLLYEFGLSLGDTLPEVPRNLVNLTGYDGPGSYMMYYNHDSLCHHFFDCDTTYVLGDRAAAQPWFMSGFTWEYLGHIVFQPGIGTLYGWPITLALDVTGQHYFLKRLTSNGQEIFYHPEIATALDQGENGLGMQVFPNPATARVHLQATVKLESIRLIDMAGRVIAGWEGAGSEMTLDLTNFPRGLYRLAAELDGQLVSRPLLLQ